jgi:hypothetical protein
MAWVPPGGTAPEPPAGAPPIPAATPGPTPPSQRTAPPPPPPGPYGYWPPLQPKGGSARTGPLPLHPMTLSDVLDGAFKLLKANARTVVTVTALFVVPIRLVAAYLQRDVLGGQGIVTVIRDPSTNRVATDSAGNGQLVATAVGLLATVLVLPFVAGAVSRVVSASYLGDQLEPGPALAAAGRRWWSLTASWFLVHLCEFGLWGLAAVAVLALGDGGIAAAVVLGLAGIPVALAAMTLFVAVAPAVVVEELGPIRGLRRSASLLRRRFWGVLGIALLGGLLASVLGSVLGVVPQTVGLLIGGRHGGWVLIGVGGILASLVTVPLVAIISTLVYFDGRIRHEGFDLHVIAAELGLG